jgi:hypothetical protein
LFARDIHCSRGPVNMSVIGSTISPSYMWSYHFFSQRKLINMSSVILLCCQLGLFSIHSSTAFTQATSIKLRNSFQHQHLVDLIQLYSFTSLSRTSRPTSSGITVHGNFRFVIFLTHAHHHDALIKGRCQPCFLLVHMVWLNRNETAHGDAREGK